MNLTSPAFQNNKPIPSQFAGKGVRGGANLSPPLHWSDPPPQTKSFILSMTDLHPMAQSWIHWLVIDIPRQITSLPRGASPSGIPAGAAELFNSFGDKGYGGPRPPRGSGIHRYMITLHALDVGGLALSSFTSSTTLDRILKEHLISSSSLTGIFEQS